MGKKPTTAEWRAFRETGDRAEVIWVSHVERGSGRSIRATPIDERYRSEALAAVPIGQNEDVGRKIGEAEAVARWLKYGPEAPADPTVTEIVANALSDIRRVRYTADGAVRDAGHAREIAETALTAAKDNGSGATILAFLAFIVALVALVVGILA